MSDFHNYNLSELANRPKGVYELADGLLPEIADATGYDLGVLPTRDSLRGFIGHISPAMTLQDNISLAQERLSTSADAVTIAADWAERSGCLQEIEGRFSNPAIGYRNDLAVAVFNTVVGRWQERRAKKVIDLLERSGFIRRVAIFAGNRVMSEDEHPEVGEIARRDGALPTEAKFASQYTSEMLRAKSLRVQVIAIASTNADDIFKEGLSENDWLLNTQVLAVGNAPSTIQVAAQFRKAAKSLGYWDDSGSMLFMAGDGIPVARHGEGKATHQNPFSALGPIARNALMLHEQSQSEPFNFGVK